MTGDCMDCLWSRVVAEGGCMSKGSLGFGMVLCAGVNLCRKLESREVIVFGTRVIVCR